MVVFNIKVISDTVCPFCYLGKARLEKAIAMYKNNVPGGSSDIFNVSWSAFYLDPNSPKVGVPLRERMTQKFGADRLELLNARLCQMGEADGICFNMNSKVGSTRDSHRLIEFSKTKGNDIEDRVVSQVMKAYFEEGADITSRDMLAAAAEKAGLDRGEVDKFLASDEYGADVDGQAMTAVQAGISGVPFFTINGKHPISGAQDVSVFLKALSEARSSSD